MIGKIPRDLSFSEQAGYAYNETKYDNPHCTHNSVLVKCLFLKVPLNRIKILLRMRGKRDMLPPYSEPYDNIVNHGPRGHQGAIGNCYDPLTLDQNINSLFHLGLACALHSDEAIQYFIKHFELHLTNVFAHLICNCQEEYILRFLKYVKIEDWFLHHYLSSKKDTGTNISINVVNALTTENSLKFRLPRGASYCWFYSVCHDDARKLFNQAWKKLFVSCINEKNKNK